MYEDSIRLTSPFKGNVLGRFIINFMLSFWIDWVGGY